MEPPSQDLATIYEEFARIYLGLEKYNLSLEHLKLAYRYNPKPLLSFKMGQLYDLYLQNKKLALTYYDGYLTMINDSDDQNAYRDSIAAYDLSIKEYVEERIRILKEEMFFEGTQ